MKALRWTFETWQDQKNGNWILVEGRKWEEEEGWYLVEENEAGLEDGNQL